ncbi:MAG: hypothetical protein GYB18_08370 [Oceanospirillales bacterium]|nr:hypothetical protein [Oceanospirillales bacterium]
MRITQEYIEVLKLAHRRAADTGYEQTIVFNRETQQFDYFATADAYCCMEHGYDVVESVMGEGSHCGVYVDSCIVESAIDDRVDEQQVISLIS